jgi:acyl-CoA synthetase (NDP forming)
MIVAYIEGLREGKHFFQLAKEITKKKPIIVIKAGSTERAARAAKSHTAALAGSDAAYNAMFKQSGVIRVEDEYELFDVVAALSSLPLPRGKRVGILTEGGGFGVVATEACEKVGLEIPSFTLATMERLEALLPPRWSHGNPADMTDTIVGGEPVTFPCLWAIMEDPNVDAAMLLGGLGATAYFPQLVIDIDKASASIKDGLYQLTKYLEGEELKEANTIDERMKKYRKPLVVAKIMTEDVAEAKIFGLLRERGIPIYPDARRAVKVLHHLAWYREYLDAS